MEQRVKVGDRIKIIKPWMTQGRYEKGDVLTVMSVEYAGVYVLENDWYIDQKEFEVITDEIITDEIKPGDKVTLIDKPWEWDGWAKLDRKRRCAYGKMIGKEITVCNIYQSPALVELKDIPCANTGVWFIPLALLRKVEPVKLPFDVEPEPVKAEPEPGDLFKVIHNDGHHHHRIGDIVRRVCIGTRGRSYLTKCDETGIEQFVHITDLEPYVEPPAKHRYTDEQITEAKCYLAEKMFDNTCRIITKPTEAHPVAVVIGGLGTGTAKCAPDDEFNVYIGLMVAFKRYHGEPLPTWIRG